jgi:hypothetical protein
MRLNNITEDKGEDLFANGQSSRDLRDSPDATEKNSTRGAERYRTVPDVAPKEFPANREASGAND